MDLLSEGEQWEALKAWLRRNLPALLSGLAVGAIGYFGWQWYEGRREAKALDSSVQYGQLLELYSKGDLTGGNAKLEELRRVDEKSFYVAAGRLAAAKAMLTRGDLEGSANTLKRVAEGAEPNLALVARARLARVQIEQAKYDDALATLAAAKDVGAYAGEFAQVRGDALLRKGDAAGALKEYQRAREETARIAGQGAAEMTGSLDLKINDLEGSAPAPAAAPAPLPTPTTTTEKP